MNLQSSEETFGDRFKKVIELSGDLQKDAAEKLDCDPSYISRWINNKGLPDFYQIEKICKSYNISADWLMGLSNSSLAKEIFSIEGISWIEYIPSYISQRVRIEIEVGIDLFRAIYEEQLSIRDCFSDKRFNGFSSWTSLSRAFRAAVSSGCLQIIEVKRNNELEQAVTTLYRDKGIIETVVADIPAFEIGVITTELIAFLASHAALPSSSHGNRIGIGPGYTILRMAELSTPSSSLFSGTEWLPLMSERNTTDKHPSYYANYIVSILGRKYPGSQALTLPYLKENEREVSSLKVAYSDAEIKAIETILYYPKLITHAFTTVGSVSNRHGNSTHFIGPIESSDGEQGLEAHVRHYEKLGSLGLAEKVVGEQLGYMYDYQGDWISHPEIDAHVNQQLFTLKWSDLQHLVNTSRVWVIATGNSKKDAVLGAIHSGTVNSLVIDKTIANYLLEDIS